MKKQVMKAKKLLIMPGETTNSHYLECDKDVEYTSENPATGIEMLLKGTGVLGHSDSKTGEYTKEKNHAPIVLSPGKYSSTVQSEFSPFDATIRNTFD